jgi:hypothetical protein
MEMRSADYYEYEDELEYCRELLKELDYDYYPVSSKDRQLDDYSTNFYGNCFAQLAKLVSFGEDIEISVELRCFARSGYYEGASLDWEVLYSYWSCDYHDTPPDEDDLKYYFQEKDSKVIQKGLSDLDILVKKMIADVEAVYAECSTPLNVFAKFSNGETWYKAVEDEQNKNS